MDSEVGCFRWSLKRKERTLVKWTCLKEKWKTNVIFVNVIYLKSKFNFRPPEKLFDSIRKGLLKNLPSTELIDITTVKSWLVRAMEWFIQCVLSFSVYYNNQKIASSPCFSLSHNVSLRRKCLFCLRHQHFLTYKSDFSIVFSASIFWFFPISSLPVHRNVEQIANRSSDSRRNRVNKRDSNKTNAFYQTGTFQSNTFFQNFLF